MPIESLAKRGDKAIAFGPFKPVGLDGPAHGVSVLTPLCSCGRTIFYRDVV